MKSARTVMWLALPPALWLAAFFLLPMAGMLLTSLEGVPGAPGLGLAQYRILLGSPRYLRELGQTSVVSALVASLSVLLAYPLAWFLAFRAGRHRALLLLLLMAPGWVSYLLRVFSWKLMLGTGGALNQILMGLGLLREPTPWLLYSMSAVVAVLVYVWIPFAALPIFVALERVDRSLLEAAADLGARPWQAFRRVTLPLSLPGVSAAFCLVFIPTLGEYVTPLLVGGPRGQLYGNLVQSQFQKAMNWPFGSALSLMMLLVAVPVMLLLARSGRLDLGEG
ncbi:MAG TPA: ABC transporter permease [Anaerolineae bacterium]|nr:ABC transporter permease [Anaerolineae bacterium]